MSHEPASQVHCRDRPAGRTDLVEQPSETGGEGLRAPLHQPVRVEEDPVAGPQHE